MTYAALLANEMPNKTINKAIEIETGIEREGWQKEEGVAGKR